MKNISIYILIFLGTSLYSPLRAEPTLTVTCDAPKGSRVAYGSNYSKDDKLELSAEPDSMAGVKPVFIYDDQDPKMMAIIWGDTQIEGVETQPPKAVKGIIVHLSDQQISVLETNPNGVWLHSLYPDLEFGVFHRATHHSVGIQLISNLFYARCKFR